MTDRMQLIIETVLVASLLLPGSLFSLDAQACVNSTVRDGAFLVPRDIHRLCVVVEADDSIGQETYERLSGWFETSGKGLNTELSRVAAGDPAVRWNEYGIPSAPPSLPVVVLAGYHLAERRSFFVDYWEPGPRVEDLEALKESPVREAIRREVVRRLAVLLYVRGTDSDAGIAENVLDSVVETWSRREPLGISVVRLDRSDERERLLLSFIGVESSGPDWVGVVFGRGKLMQPLQGSEITEARLNDLIEILLGDCSCLHPPSSFGVDIPMVWDETLDAAIIPLRDRDIAIALGWSVPVVAEASGLSIGGRIVTTAMYTLGALVIVVTVATILIVRRKSRRDATSLIH